MEISGRGVAFTAAPRRTPHQSAIGSEEPMDDSFSPRKGEKPLSRIHPATIVLTPRKVSTKGFSLEGGAPRSESKIQ